MPWLGRGFFVFLAIFLGIAGRSIGDDGWEGHILSFTEQNDAPFRTDRHYTQGANVSYLSADDAMPRWLEKTSEYLPALGLHVQAQKFGIAGGQEIYTPENLHSRLLVTNDRPYAGWLFGRFTLQRRGKGPWDWMAMENLSLELGVIGSDSLARQAQDITHHEDPHGWGNQLRNELGINLKYDRRYLWRIQTPGQEWAFDFIPGALASGGNVSTYVGLIGALRAGYHVPNEFAVSTQPQPPRYGAYVFCSAEGRYVERNIFLDGNTFAHSHYIGKNSWIADLSCGVTIVLKRVELTGAATQRTREFDHQRGPDAYCTGVVTLKF